MNIGSQFLPGVLRQGPAPPTSPPIGILSKDTGTLNYCAAGHPPAIVNRKGLTEFLEFGDLPVGILKGSSYRDRTTTLRPGDILLLYTDGVIESRRGLEFFGSERLATLVQSSGLKTAKGLLSKVFNAVIAYSNGVLRDDVALPALSLRERRSA